MGPVKTPCADCVGKKMKVCNTQQVDVKNWLKKKKKRRHDNVTMLQRKFIRIFVKRMGLNTVKSGMSMLRKGQ